MKDFGISRHKAEKGTIFLFHPQTKRAEDWIKENMKTGGVPEYGGAICLDEDVAPIVFEGINVDGLDCEPLLGN